MIRMYGVWILTLLIAACGHGLARRSVPVVSEGECFVDEAKHDASLQAFRVQLLTAVRHRNLADLALLLHPEIRFEAQSQGRQTFIDAYDLAKADSPIWRQLEEDLDHGGRLVRPDAFCTPYYACPVPSRSGEVVAVVLESDVAVMGGPGVETPILTRLSCGTIELRSKGGPTPPAVPAGWIAVWLPSGAWGFVPDTKLAIPATWLGISRIGGRWWVTDVGASDG